MDLKIDGNYDIVIENGDFVLVDGVDAIAQHITIRLNFFLGEWFLDTRLGVPYYEQILGQKPRLEAVRAIFRRVILETPGMLSISKLNLDYIGDTRALNVTFDGVATDGEFTYSQELII